jgi:uncharacterized membrane protein
MKPKTGDRYPLAGLAVMAVVAIGLAFSWPSTSYGEEKDDLPPRKISVAPEYPGIVVVEGKDVSIDLTVTNRGRENETIEITLSEVPRGWKAWLETYRYEITGVHVPSDDSKTITLKAEPDDDVGPGMYTMLIKGQTQDGELTSSSRLLITVKKKEEEKKSKGLAVETSYPVLQGPTDATFEFSLEVDNESDKDTIFNLTAQGPENWDVSFKPAYEQKFISSLRIKANQTQTMAVEVRPHPLAGPGTYPIEVKVSSETAQAEKELKVVLTGTHKLEVGTLDELLSLRTLQGQAANISIYVKNSGSATQNNVQFMSFKPENWKVEFRPERIDTLAPGDLEQVEVAITSAERALVGDYSVSLAVEGEKTTKDVELRVTVQASTVWGWLGIGIIVLVIAGLVFMFVRLGRR